MCRKMAFCLRLWEGKSRSRRVEEKKKTGWRGFSMEELHTATNNFNLNVKLGEGGFGSVYWGQLSDGSQVAVKRLKAWSAKAELQFAVEVEVLARVQHENLLTLRGYCAEGQERLIVYDYMPNLSLLSHLHGKLSSQGRLDWDKRLKIATGSAEGIAYLHQHNPHIIHRDIKASNVLLNSEFQPKVADFGLARFIPDGATHVTTGVKGTPGYVAPEYAMLGKAKDSCDVYSFGVLLLELVSGKKPVEKINASTRRPITEWALALASENRFSEMADLKLHGRYNLEELKRLVLVGLLCVQQRPEKRPRMLEVVSLLKGEQTERLIDLEIDNLFTTDKSSGFSATDESTNFISDQTSLESM